MKTFDCNKPEDFIAFYTVLFEKFRPKRILEIGVQTGRSLKMWAEACGDAEIVGLDIETPKEVVPESIKCVLGSQGDESTLRSLGNFDLIVDDGSHKMSHQINTFNILYKQLNPGGVYVVEDLETSEHPAYEALRDIPRVMNARKYFTLLDFTIRGDLGYLKKP